MKESTILRALASAAELAYTADVSDARTLDELYTDASELLESVPEGTERLDSASIGTDRARALAFGLFEPCRVSVTFEVITHESAEHGEAAEHGWEDEEGAWYASPELAARDLWREHGGGALECNGDQWATVYDEHGDICTGERTNYGFHPRSTRAEREDRTNERHHAVRERYFAELARLAADAKARAARLARRT